MKSTIIVTFIAFLGLISNAHAQSGTAKVCGKVSRITTEDIGSSDIEIKNANGTIEVVRLSTNAHKLYPSFFLAQTAFISKANVCADVEWGTSLIKNVYSMTISN
ncbi:MAG: hypothetical protein AB7F59_04385 [Bdellovibrionales bacterium]